MAKVLFENMTESEKIKSQLKSLNLLNQRLKNVCDLYYIGWDGYVYLHTIKGCIEKRAYLWKTKEDPNHLVTFRGAMIKPNEFFSFYKDLKKAKTLVFVDKSDLSETNQFCINITQEDNLDLKHTINIVCSSEKDNLNFINNSYAINEMYKRFFDVNDIFNKETAECYDMSTDIPELVGGLDFTVGNEDTSEMITGLTRELFEDIKKADTVLMAYHIPELAQDDRGYFIFENTNDEYTMTSIIPYLKGE